MHVTVTGADGLLGSNLVRLLLARGHAVSVMIHPSSKSRTLDGLAISRHYGDVLQPETLSDPFSGTDVVIHAAASTSVWPSRSEFVRRINVEGTRNVIDACLKDTVSRLIYVGSASSVNAQPRAGDRFPFPGARFGLDYIDSKFEAFGLVMDAVNKRGLPAIAILPTFMIGPYDSLPGAGKMILALARGKLKVYSKGGRNFIYVGDVATAIANSLDMGQVGRYYITGNENLTYREFFRKAAEVLGVPRPRIAVPSWLVKTAGLAGSLSGKITGKEPLLSYPMARISCEKQFVESREAMRAWPATNRYQPGHT